MFVLAAGTAPNERREGIVLLRVSRAIRSSTAPASRSGLRRCQPAANE